MLNSYNNNMMNSCSLVLLLVLFLFTNGEGFVQRRRETYPAPPPWFESSELVIPTSSSGPSHTFVSDLLPVTTSAPSTASRLIQSSTMTDFEPSSRSSAVAWQQQRPQTMAASLSVNANRMFKSYMDRCNRKPVSTKALTSAVIGGFGDILSQYFASATTGTTFALNIQRTITFMAVGFIFKGPFYHAWYDQMNKVGQWMESRLGSSPLRQCLAQLTLDQTVGVAIFYPLYFYAYEILSSLVSLKVPLLSVATAKLSAGILSVITANYYIWPFAQYVSFRYCPPQLRVLMSNLVAVFWNCYLCAKIAA